MKKKAKSKEADFKMAPDGRLIITEDSGDEGKAYVRDISFSEGFHFACP